MKDSIFQSRQYIAAFVVVTLASLAMAVMAGDTNLGLAASVLGIYVLHLISVRYIAQGQQEQWETLRELETLMGELSRAERLSPSQGLAAVGSESGGEVGISPVTAEEADAGEASEAGSGGNGGQPGTATASAPGGSSGEAAAEAVPEVDMDPESVPVPRHFALGTVAIIKNVLTPDEVAQVLMEQRRRPKRRFGELAVEMGLLGETELESLLLTQQEGVYKKKEIKAARERLESYRRKRQTSLEE